MMIFMNEVFVSLFAGAICGAVFLLIKIVRIILHIGRIGTFSLDIVFSFFCAFLSFLLSIAISGGKLRFTQAAVTLAGAFSIIMVIDPFVVMISNRVNIIFAAVIKFINKNMLKCLKLRLKPREKKMIKSKKGLKSRKKF